MATRGNVLDRVTDLLEDKTTTTRSRMEPWCNFVLSEMKQAGVLGPDMTTTVSVVAGTSEYNLPTDLDHVVDMYLEDNLGSPLVWVPKWKFDEFLADDDDFTGTPEYYTFSTRETLAVTGKFKVYPVPDAAETLRINYQGNFTTFSSDSDILNLNDDVFTTAVWGVYRIWTRLEENDDIQQASAEFRESLKMAKYAQWGRIGRTYTVEYDDPYTA